RESKNATRGLEALEGDSRDGGADGEAKEKKEVRTEYDRMVGRSSYSTSPLRTGSSNITRSINVLTGHYAWLVQDGGAKPDDQDDFLTVKRSGYDSEVPNPDNSDVA